MKILSETIIGTQEGVEENGVTWKVETIGIRFKNAAGIEDFGARVRVESVFGDKRDIRHYTYIHPITFGYDVDDIAATNELIEASIQAVSP